MFEVPVEEKQKRLWLYVDNNKELCGKNNFDGLVG
jgi:hypothetical protein